MFAGVEQSSIYSVRLKKKKFPKPNNRKARGRAERGVRTSGPEVWEVRCIPVRDVRGAKTPNGKKYIDCDTTEIPETRRVCLSVRGP